MRFLFHTTFKKDKHSILAVILLGSLSHFLYELSGGTAIFALFCPINESVWEHLKLLFFPFLFITVIQWYRQKPPAFFLLPPLSRHLMRTSYHSGAVLYLHRRNRKTLFDY